MAIDPSIPLSVQGPRFGEIIGQGLLQFRQQQRQETADERANELLQLKKEEVARKAKIEQDKSNLRSGATFFQGVDRKGDIVGQIDAKIEEVVQGSEESEFLNELRAGYLKDPDKALSIGDRVVEQARLQKLIPAKEKGFTLGQGQKRFTAEGEEIAAVAPKPSAALSIGEKATDRAFSKEFVKWTTGGFADVRKNIIQLKSVEKRLASGEENLTGPVVGRTPDIVRAGTNPASLDVRDQVEEVVQRNLRLILGAQFTEREGIRLIARAYNENLDESVNKRRLNRLIVAIEDAALAKQAAVDYFNENGTLSGFKGEQFTMEDINRRLEEELKEEKEAGVKIAKPKTQADFSKLKSGTEYISPSDGKRYTKP